VTKQKVTLAIDPTLAAAAKTEDLNMSNLIEEAIGNKLKSLGYRQTWVKP